MTGIWILITWICMGIINIPIWRHVIDDNTAEVAHFLNERFVRRFMIIILMVFAPCYFFAGIYVHWNDYRIERKVKKMLKEFCKRSGLDFEKEFGHMFVKKKSPGTDNE